MRMMNKATSVRTLHDRVIRLSGKSKMASVTESGYRITYISACRPVHDSNGMPTTIPICFLR